MKWTYRYETYWVTTDEELEGYIERYEVTEQEADVIDTGVNPDEVLGIEDPIYIEPTQE